jgi:hypothetical protein
MNQMIEEKKRERVPSLITTPELKANRGKGPNARSLLSLWEGLIMGGYVRIKSNRR